MGASSSSCSNFAGFLFLSCVLCLMVQDESGELPNSVLRVIEVGGWVEASAGLSCRSEINTLVAQVKEKLGRRGWWRVCRGVRLARTGDVLC